MSGFDVLGPGGSAPVRGVKPYGSEKLFGDGVKPKEIDGEDFAGSLQDALQEVRGLQIEARDKARGLATGEPVQVHDLMISMGKSEVAFNMMLEVRNKLLEAWQTLQRSVS